MPHATPRPQRDATLQIAWAWWINPFWLVLLLTGATAIGAILLPAHQYSLWNQAKYLDHQSSKWLIFGIGSLLSGIIAGSSQAWRGGNRTLHFSSRQLEHLTKTYRITLTLTLLGYLFWLAIAASKGATIGSLTAVVARDPGAISALKESSRPVAGLSTLTQFGPIAIAVGYLLRKIGVIHNRRYLIVVILAALRMVFYAERLGLIEVIVPFVVIASLTISPDSRWRGPTRAMPLIAAPALYAVFAASEYTRSWIHYQWTTNQSFASWSLTRLLGYYATAYNNSALYSATFDREWLPYFSVDAFWNSPGVSAIANHPVWQGTTPENWWDQTLLAMANPEFTNKGSFLVTAAEFGVGGMILFWLLVGGALGYVFTRLTRGSVVALLALPTLVVGTLELPLILYWTEGRAVPVFVALIAIAATYPRSVTPASRELSTTNGHASDSFESTEAHSH